MLLFSQFLHVLGLLLKFSNSIKVVLLIRKKIACKHLTIVLVLLVMGKKMEVNFGLLKIHGEILGEKMGLREFLEVIILIILVCVLLLVNLELLIGVEKVKFECFFF